MHAKAKLRAYLKSPKQAAVMDSIDENPPMVILQRDSTLQVELIGGQLPTKSSEDVAGLDLHASQNHTIPPHTRTTIPTSLRI